MIPFAGAGLTLGGASVKSKVIDLLLVLLGLFFLLIGSLQ